MGIVRKILKLKGIYYLQTTKNILHYILNTISTVCVCVYSSKKGNLNKTAQNREHCITNPTNTILETKLVGF